MNYLRYLPLLIFIRLAKNIGPRLVQVWSLALLTLIPCCFVGCGRTESTYKGAIATDSAQALSPNMAERSFAPGPRDRESEQLEFNTNEFDHVVENDFTKALSNPQSTFAVDVDTASYSIVRRFLSHGKIPPAGAVRIEELVNYFSYQYPEPGNEHPFSVTTRIVDCPWQPKNKLVQVGIKGRSLDFAKRPAENLVFLVDVSGSMNSADKLPLVQSTLKLLVEQLDERDRIAIVVYAGASGIALPSTACSDPSAIRNAIDALRPSGATNGAQGIQLAYEIAQENKISDGVNRVILCTDGDFNVGISNHSDLVRLIEEKAKSGVFLSVLGFGEGNLKDSTMEKIADHGNGNYAYIDSMLEARKVLVEQAGSTLLTIAKDVKIQVDFNPLKVGSYRLIGYENRVMKNQDFRDDQKDAGEIGSGHTVTAFYEIVPAESETAEQSKGESEFVQNSPRPDADPSTWLVVNLRYKLPQQDTANEFQVRMKDEPQSFSEAPSELRFAASVVAFGMLLRESKFSSSVDWGWVTETAQANIGKDPLGIRSEFVQLAKTAKSLGRPKATQTAAN